MFHRWSVKVGVGVFLATGIVAGVWGVQAFSQTADKPFPKPEPSQSFCPLLVADYQVALSQNNVTLEKKLQAEALQDRCPPLGGGKFCTQGIANIGSFLLTCPTDDKTAYSRITQDFHIRYEGSLLSVADLTSDVNAVCTYRNKTGQKSNPMPSAKRRAEYVVVQTLRTIYAMDGQGTKGCLYPWTKGSSLYMWMKPLVGGVDIHAQSGDTECCEPYDNGTTISYSQPGDDQYPNDYFWGGITGQVAVFMHETRHAPGNVNPSTGVHGYPHVSCCPAGAGACDDHYDEGTDMTPYAIQFWLFRAWLDNNVKTGWSCLPQSEFQPDAQYFQNAANDYDIRFCHSGPPPVTAPAEPGGVCMAPHRLMP